MGKVLIIHYRIGKTDGVSLEISNWKEILERDGWKVETCAGPINVGADYEVKDLEPQGNRLIYNLDEESFGGFKKYTETSFLSEYKKVQEKLFQDFCRILEKSKPDRIIVSNIFSVGENIPAAGALLRALTKFKIPTVAVHHDFWWENERYSNPSCGLVKEELERFMPPNESFIKHAVINEIAKLALAKRKQIYAVVLHDCIDFRSSNTDVDGACEKLLAGYGVTDSDLVVLQGTRIVHRKNIETAMDFVKLLSKKIPLVEKKRVVFVMAGYAERRDVWYQKALRSYATNLGITLVELNGLVNGYGVGDKNVCKLLDVYPYADLVTYPSVYEGFGNQFLEAVYAKKPLVMFEYPVYKTDIEPLGFEIISLGNKATYDGKTRLAHIPEKKLEEAVAKSIQILEDSEKRKQVADKNFKLAEQEFSFEKIATLWHNFLR